MMIIQNKVVKRNPVAVGHFPYEAKSSSLPKKGRQTGGK
jgi:hypothetical protein